MIDRKYSDQIRAQQSAVETRVAVLEAGGGSGGGGSASILQTTYLGMSPDREVYISGLTDNKALVEVYKVYSEDYGMNTISVFDALEQSAFDTSQYVIFDGFVHLVNSYARTLVDETIIAGETMKSMTVSFDSNFIAYGGLEVS